MDINNNDGLYRQAALHVENHSEETRFASQAQTLAQRGFVVTLLDIDAALPPTPVDAGYVDNAQIPVAAVSLTAYHLAMGLYPVVYQGENHGRLVRHVVPRRGVEHQVSSQGSRVTFYPHVDNPDLALRNEVFPVYATPSPDTLTLLCLRKKAGVATSLLLLDDVLGDLSEQDLARLSEPCFQVKRPASFEYQSVCSHDVPLLLQDERGHRCSRFDYHNVITHSARHLPALERMRASARDEKKWLSLELEPGQVLTFDNQRTLHSRNGFVPDFNGRDRWLLRMFGLYQKPDNSLFISTDCRHHLKTA